MLADFLQSVTHSKVGHHNYPISSELMTEKVKLLDSKKDGREGGLLLGRWGPIFQTLAFIQFVYV